jgi:hypothetical protein
MLAAKAAFRFSSYHTFIPRPDRPEQFDQQYGFCWAKDSVSFLVGGNASGTTCAAAYKTGKFLIELQEPPRRDTPFWVIAESYEQVCAVCWGEKLHGQQFIPNCEVDWENVSWVSRKDGWPKNVPLKPWKGKPGKIPFFSSITKVRKEPPRMPTIENRQGNKLGLKLKSILPESME